MCLEYFWKRQNTRNNGCLCKGKWEENGNLILHLPHLCWVWWSVNGCNARWNEVVPGCPQRATCFYLKCSKPFWERSDSGVLMLSFKPLLSADVKIRWDCWLFSKPTDKKQLIQLRSTRFSRLDSPLWMACLMCNANLFYWLPLSMFVTV